MTRNVRVIVANRPRLMRELILATIADQPDIGVVGEVQKEEDICEAVEQKRADFLIVALDNPNARPTVCDVHLSKFPGMKTLLSRRSATAAFSLGRLWVFTPYDVEASGEGILGALRSAIWGAGGSRESLTVGCAVD